MEIPGTHTLHESHQFKEKNPDIVITDIRMPVMDGLEMIKEIKKLRKVPIIITTGYNDEEFLIEAIELGIDRYIKKPISQNRLVAWDPATGDLLIEFDAPGIDVYALAYNPDGTRLVLSLTRGGQRDLALVTVNLPSSLVVKPL